MNIKQNKLEVLKAGADDSLNLLDPALMDEIEGGWCFINICGTNIEKPDPTDPPTEKPTEAPTDEPTEEPTEDGSTENLTSLI